MCIDAHLNIDTPIPWIMRYSIFFIVIINIFLAL